MSTDLSPQNGVLQSRELLRIILLFLVHPEFDTNFWATGDREADDSIVKSTREELYSVARTSKSFLSPATDILWKKMNSILPVLKLLSSFVFVDGRYTLSGLDSLENSQALRYYGSKIQNLHLTDSESAIEAHVILRLTTGNVSILPNLKALKSKKINNLDALFLAYSNCLASVELWFEGNQDVILSYLLYLRNRGTPLKKITLYDTTGEIVLALAAFPLLESITLMLMPTLKYSAFASWSSFSNLTSLAIMVINLHKSSGFEFDGIEHAATKSSVAFNALRILELGIGAEVAVKLLRTLKPLPNLTSMRIQMVDIYGGGGETMAANFSRCLEETARISRASLRQFRLKAFRSGCDVLQGTLSPLYNCHKLAVLRMNNISLSMNDNIIRELKASGWTSLRILNLPRTCGGDSPSLLSLGSIALLFPGVFDLKIPIDFRLQNEESLTRERNTPRKPHNLRKLCIINTQIPLLEGHPNATNTPLSTKMMISVSRYIEHCFPDIQNMELEHDGILPEDVIGLDEWWERVIALVHEWSASEKALSEALTLRVP